MHNLNFSVSEAVEEVPEELAEDPKLLPDGWIAIVCGVAKNWGEEDLPEGFFVAPRDMWMPDLTAVGDVLLGPSRTCRRNQYKRCILISIR